MDLATMAVRIEKHYDIPQDIEWAYSPEGRLVLLQTRPLEVRQDQSASELLPGVTPLVHEGQTASAGTAHGVVHIVRKDVDILVLPDNAILVCVEAAPKWAAVLNRCQGVITEQGSVAGHLANVAREFKVPALFGVPSATSLLESGQEITLDADNCAVYAGLQETLLDRKPQRPNMMAGSPVFQTLQRVNRHIIPLNLLDPDGLDFTPANCKTLHDITRFCHEKSVQEMFSFGRDHNFSPRSSKQLKTIVPIAMVDHQSRGRICQRYRRQDDSAGQDHFRSHARRCGAALWRIRGTGLHASTARASCRCSSSPRPTGIWNRPWPPSSRKEIIS